MLVDFDYKSTSKLFGLPLIYISFKYRDNKVPVPAVGVLAIGIISIGQFTIGVISISQFTIAVYAIAQFALAYSGIAQMGCFLMDKL